MTLLWPGLGRGHSAMPTDDTPSLSLMKWSVQKAVKPNGKEIGVFARGYLTWGKDLYECISGPWGKGMLPNGVYDVKIRNVVLNDPDPGYKDPVTSDSWFIPVELRADTGDRSDCECRGGFGIHPDGNVEGTAGCIGLVGKDAGAFRSRWNKVPIKQRPTMLSVGGAAGLTEPDLAGVMAGQTYTIGGTTSSTNE
jgi:hypothetical protein